MLITNDSQVESIFNSYITSNEPNARYSNYEMELKNIKKVLVDLSILLAYDLEPCQEIINIKHIHINGISYPIFKECLINYLDKTEKKLTTMFIAEQSSAPIEEIVERDAKALVTDQEKIKDTIALTDDIGLIMLHRSLFILKKKFEMHEKEIKEIYKKYNEGVEDPFYIIDFEKVRPCLVEIGKKVGFDFDRMDNFNDVVREEINVGDVDYFSNEELMLKFVDFLRVERRKYNFIYKEKKTKEHFNLEDYKYYVPTGVDELKKEFIETIKEEKEEDKEDEKVLEVIKEEERKSNLDLPKENKNVDNVNIGSELGSEGQSSSNLVLSPIKNNDKTEQLSPSQNDKTITNQQQSIIGEETKRSLSPISHNDNKQNNDSNNIEEENNVINTSKIRGRKISMSSLNEPNEEIDSPKVNAPIIPKFNTHSYTKYYLFIETLPLIIADFITGEGNVVILDHGDELRDELRSLFDNEITTRMGSEASMNINIFKTEKLKDYLLSLAKVDKNISTYENMLLKEQITKDNKFLIEKALASLKVKKDILSRRVLTIQNDTNTYNEYEEKIKYENNDIVNDISKVVSKADMNYIEENSNNNITTTIKDISNVNINNVTNDSKNFSISITQRNNQSAITTISGYLKIKPKKKMTKEEKREMAKKEIFYFYSHQHTMVGYKSTFDTIKDKMEHMNLSEFCKFCIEFKILVTKEKVIEIFKKSAENTKDMNYSNFDTALQKIALEINKEKIRLTKKRIFRLENSKKGNNTELNAMKNMQIDDEIKKNKEDISKLKSKTNEELNEELYLYLEIDEEKEYRQKMKGFILPYNNNFGALKQLPKLNIFRHPKKLDIKTAREIKMLLEQRKDEVEKEKRKINRLKGIERELQKINLEKKTRSKSNTPSIPNNSINLKQIKAKKIYLKSPSNSNMLNENAKQINFNYINNNNKPIIQEPPVNLPISNDRSESRFIMEKSNSGVIIDYVPKEEPKNNKFTWDTLEKTSSNNIVNEDDIKKLIY